MSAKLLGALILLGGLALAGERGVAKPAENEDSRPSGADGLHGWKQEVTSTHSFVLHADDGGRHWRNVSPMALVREAKKAVAGNRDDLLADLSALCPIDNRHAWLAITLGGSVLMEYTSDSGQHWKETPASITADTVSISFLDESRGFLVASGAPSAGIMRKAVYGTEDGGRHWRMLSSPAVGSFYTTGIVFRSPSDGWITGTHHGGDEAPLYRTRDGGKNWGIQKLKIPGGFRGGYADVYPPVFDGKERKRGRLRVKLVRHEPAPDHESWVNYVSEDGGESWHLP